MVVSELLAERIVVLEDLQACDFASSQFAGF
jgi:hypothetical protein